jgi:hypothetical protein
MRRLALFATGFSTMGMEVVWMRLYPAINGTFVYSFAEIVAIYLLATTFGSFVYRRLRRSSIAGRIGLWFPWLCATSLVPLLSASVTFPEINVVRTRLHRPGAVLRPAGVPGHRRSSIARPETTRRVPGRPTGSTCWACVMGSLVAGLVLLPVMGTRGAAFTLASPLFLFLIAPSVRRDGHAACECRGGWRRRLRFGFRRRCSLRAVSESPGAS